jgi:hypothetical protein
MERRSRKRSSSAVSEKMEIVSERQEKMEGYCSTGQSPQWAVEPMEGYCSTGQSPQWAVEPMEEEDNDDDDEEEVPFLSDVAGLRGV